MVDTIRTSADLQNNIFPDNQAAGSITAQDIRDAVASMPHISVQGWQFFFDINAVDEGSAKVVLDGVKTQVEISPFISEDLLYPPGSPLAWNSNANEDGSGITNRINPQLLNGFGLLRLSFAAWQDSLNTRFDLEFDVSTANPPAALGNVIYTSTEAFLKGTTFADAQHFNFVIPVFLGSDFATNGGRFYITPNGDINCYQITLTLTQTFAPNPAGPG